MLVRRPGVVLVYSLLVLSTLLIVATAFSLYVLRGSRTLAVASDAAVASYVAESGVEEGLFVLRHESEAVANPVHTGDLDSPFDGTEEDGDSEPGDRLASIASSTNSRDTCFEMPAGCVRDVFFVNAGSFAELKVTSTVNEIIMDVPKDQIAFADVYDASQPIDLVGSSITSIAVQWDQDENAGWLEASLVELNAQDTHVADLRPPRTTVLGPSFHTGYCFSDLHVANLANIHRFRFRALSDDIHNLRIVGYRDVDCTATYANAVTTPLPGRTTVTATGKYRQAKQTVQISMPQNNLPSGLFGFVVFSDQSLVKLNAGSGNLEFWPRVPVGHVWPDGVAGPASTFRFTYPAAGTPAASSTAHDIGPGFSSLASSPEYTVGTPFFTLVNTIRSGNPFTSGDVSLAVRDNYGGALSIDYSFPTQTIGSETVVSEPNRPGVANRIKTCSALGSGGNFHLDALDTPPTEVRDPDTGSLIVSYYTDRCAVGVALDPTSVTPDEPLEGRLEAFADPGGTAIMNFAWQRPSAQLQVQLCNGGGNDCHALSRSDDIEMGNIQPNHAFTKSVKLCNVGTATLTLTGVNIDSQAPAAPPIVFSFPDSLPASVAPGTCTSDKDIVFLPTTVNTFTANLHVATNDPAGTETHQLHGTSFQILAPDLDGNWDCWGLGDSNGDAAHRNEIRCEWTKQAGVDHYQFRTGQTCAAATAIGSQINGEARIDVSDVSRCGATMCSYTYDVPNDSAASAADDLFRCHQVKAVDSTGAASVWSTVRGTTGVPVGSPSDPRRFFLAYRYGAANSVTDFSGDLRDYFNRHGSGVYTWQAGANLLCNNWAQQKFSFSGNFKAYMCGRNSNTPSCQLLSPDTTYVWMNSGASLLPGVSFRTNSSGVPPSDFWRGGTSLSCSSTDECQTQRNHVYSQNGTPADENGQYFRTALAANALGYTGGGDCGTVSDSWRQGTGNMTYIGQRGQFGAGRWNSNITRNNACEADVNYAIYCAQAVPAPEVDVSPLSVSFGSVTLGNVANAAVTVNNTGDAPLNVTLSRSGSAAFSITTPLSFTVAGGGSQTANVRFTPTAITNYAGSLIVSSNDADEPSVTVALSGTGFSAMSGAPSNLVVTWTNPFTYHGAWTDAVTGETNYILGSSAPVSTQATLPANSTSGNVGLSTCTQATAMGTWNFYVHGQLGPLSTADATASVARPGWEAPTNLEVEWTGATTARLHWTDNSSYENGYVVYRNGSPIGSTYAASATTTNSYLDVSNLGASSHTFTVRLFINSGAICSPARPIYSGYSNSVVYTAVSNVKRIVATNATHDGNLMGLAGADFTAKVDSFCVSDTATPGPSWRAMVWKWTGTGFGYHPEITGTVIHAGTTYVNATYRVLFTAASDNVPANNLLTPIEPGAGNPRYTWTGYNSGPVNGPLATVDNVYWADSSGGGRMGIIGHPDRVDANWHGFSGTSDPGNHSRPLYCVEQ